MTKHTVECVQECQKEWATGGRASRASGLLEGARARLATRAFPASTYFGKRYSTEMCVRVPTVAGSAPGLRWGAHVHGGTVQVFRLDAVLEEGGGPVNRQRAAARQQRRVGGVHRKHQHARRQRQLIPGLSGRCAGAGGGHRKGGWLARAWRLGMDEHSGSRSGHTRSCKPWLTEASNCRFDPRPPQHASPGPAR